jgi:hypothetical protein
MEFTGLMPCIQALGLKLRALVGTLVEFVLTFMKHQKLLTEFAHSNNANIQPDRPQTFAEQALAEAELLIGSATPQGFVKNYFNRFGDADPLSLTDKPTWFRDRNKLEAYLQGVLEEGLKKNVAEVCTAVMMHGKETKPIIFSCVAAAESQGFDYTFQKQVAVAVIERSWNKYDEAQKNMARSVPLSSVDLTEFE